VHPDGALTTQHTRPAGGGCVCGGGGGRQQEVRPWVESEMILHHGHIMALSMCESANKHSEHASKASSKRQPAQQYCVWVRVLGRWEGSTCCLCVLVSHEAGLV